MLPNPPIGTGGYAGWFMLVIVIIDPIVSIVGGLSVALGGILLGMVGLKARS